VIDYAPLLLALEDTPLEAWKEQLPGQLASAMSATKHGDLPGWFKTLEELPAINPTQVELNNSIIKIGDKDECRDAVRQYIESRLRRLHPWRKGPYSVFGVHIETEWRSDLKWDRFAAHIQPLSQRLVLDVGCGNGYHCLRMAAAGAQCVIGLEPSVLYNIQFHALQHFLQQPSVYLLPLPLESLPVFLPVFDTVFSMGVLYHRRSPFDHLLELKACLKQGGELVLETLVIDGGVNEVLVPARRYAKMRNVWFLPSCATLIMWLQRCGFTQVRCVDINKTTTQEQRSTEWMRFESLSAFLDPHDSTRTIEGLPAPQRAIFIATNP